MPKEKATLFYIDNQEFNKRERILSLDNQNCKSVDVGVQTIIIPKTYIRPSIASSFALNILEFNKLLYSPHTFSYMIVFVLISIIGAYFFVPIPKISEEFYSQRLAVIAGSFALVAFALVHYPDSLLVRPHPIFWRFILGASTAYMMIVIYLLFLDLDSARKFFKLFDDSLGKPLPERNYADDCRIYTPDKPFPFQNVKENLLDVFIFAHFLGWWFKTLIFRDIKLCIFLSSTFELLEIGFKHWLINFKECWWDSIILDVLGCNILGIYFGHLTIKYLSMKKITWVNERKNKRCVAFLRIFNLFRPLEWTQYNWIMFDSVKNYLALCFIIVLNHSMDLTYFFLKYLLWIPPPHYICLFRVYLLGCLSILAVREFYEFIVSKYDTRLGPGFWLISVIGSIELALCIKFGNQVFITPTPLMPKVLLSVAITVFIALLIYVIIKEYREPKNLQEKKFDPYNPDVDIEYKVK